MSGPVTHSRSDSRFILSAHGWTMQIAAHLGGSIAALDWHDRPILRRAGIKAFAATDMACFPLVPYANRISGGRFAFGGRTIALPRNAADGPHPLHGVGWLRPWQIAAHDNAKAVLTYDHAADAHWPWRFTAQQEVRLDAGQASIRLRIVNRDDRAMPALLGLHPYMPRRTDTWLRFSARAMWDADAQQLPVARIAADRFADWSNGAPLADVPVLDHAFDGWAGRAEIVHDALRIRLQADGAAALHLYCPADGDYFCVEPVRGAPDAFNRGRDMDNLAPGKSASISLRITVLPLDQELAR